MKRYHGLKRAWSMRFSSQLKYSTIAIVVILVDQATKYFAYTGKFGGFLNFFRPVFGKLLIPNHNFAFSVHIPHFIAYVFYIIVFGIFLSWYFSGERKISERVGFYLVVGGAFSNLIDRMFLGYVRDFIYAIWKSVFNLADVSIIVGIVLILIASIHREEILRIKK